MFEQFFLAVQQDIKLWIFFPILCAVFRAIFIYVHNPYPGLPANAMPCGNVSASASGGAWI